MRRMRQLKTATCNNAQPAVMAKYGNAIKSIEKDNYVIKSIVMDNDVIKSIEKDNYVIKRERKTKKKKQKKKNTPLHPLNKKKIKNKK